MTILALDPGKDKCGLAIARADGDQTEVLLRQIVVASAVESTLLPLLDQWPVQRIVIGDATTSRTWFQRLQALLSTQHTVVEISLVEERGSTLEARALYWQANPPRGWRRVLPLSLQSPPESIDDFAAVVLAQRFFKSL